jgi:hypothetical protein
MKHLITHNGKTYVFVKAEEEEAQQHFIDRAWWIVKTIDRMPNADKKTLYNLSYIWSNVHHFGVIYDDLTMAQLADYD